MKGFGRIEEQLERMLMVSVSYRHCVCVWGFSAGYGMYMYPLMLHVKGPPVQNEHFMHFTCLYERSSKNRISFLSGDGEA